MSYLLQQINAMNETKKVCCEIHAESRWMVKTGREQHSISLASTFSEMSRKGRPFTLRIGNL